MKILLIGSRAHAHRFISVWQGGKKRWYINTFFFTADLIWYLDRYWCLSSLLWRSGWWGCQVWVMEPRSTLLLSDLSWLGADFISRFILFFSFLPKAIQRVGSHRAGQHSSPIHGDTNHPLRTSNRAEISIHSLCRILCLCVICDNTELSPRAFWLRSWLKCGLTSVLLAFTMIY